MTETNVESFADRYEAILIAYGLSPSDLARKLGETVAKFYQYKEGVKPRSAVLDKMLAKLPDLSPDYLYRGIGPVKLTDRKLTPLSSGTEADRLRQDNQALRAVNEKLESKVEKMESQIETLNAQIVRLSELNFTESNSQTTEFAPHYHPHERLVIQGFQQPKGPLDILAKIGCTKDADGVWGVPFTPMDIVGRRKSGLLVKRG